MMNDAQIIVELGGPCEVARLLKVKQPRVSNWKKRGIADGYKPAIYALAEQAGFADRIDKTSFFGFWPDAAE